MMTIANMAKIIVIFLTFGFVCHSYAETNKEEVDVFMSRYISGHSDTSLLPPLFSTAAKVEGINKGQFISYSVEEFLMRTKNIKPSKFAHKNYYRILKLNKNTAVTLANVYVEDNCFTDYLTLAKISQHWVIVYKSFSDVCENNHKIK